MHFKSSNRIFNGGGFSRDEIERVDRFLARRHTRQFTLRDAMDHTSVKDGLGRVLDAYIDKGILRKTNIFYCPIHDISIEVVNSREGKCIDCGMTHLLRDCETEQEYQRIKEPDSWSDEPGSTTTIPAQRREVPYLQDRRVRIALMSGAILAIVAIAGIGANLYMHFNPITVPIPTPHRTPTVSLTAEAPTQPVTPEFGTLTATVGSTSSQYPVTTPGS